MALFVLGKLILQTQIRSHPLGLDVWFLVAWAFAGSLCDKYHNLMCWLDCEIVPVFARNVNFQLFRFSFFYDRLNLKNQNRFDPLTKERKLSLLQLVQVKTTLSVDGNLLAWTLIVLEANNLNCWPSLIFTSLMLWLFKNKNRQLHCNFRIIPVNLPIELEVNLGQSVCEQNFSLCGKLVSTTWRY